MERAIVAVNNWTTEYLKKKYGLRKENNQRKRDRTKSVNGLRITEHAIIRYFERIEGYNIDDIRQKITIGAPRNLVGIKKYTSGDIQVICEGNCVLTLYPIDNHLGNNIKGLEKLGG